MHANTKTLAQNDSGRDFVVGDIHGCFDLVDEALREVGFQAGADRLLCVGDLIDRGPKSSAVHEFLDRPYVYAVLGNHESSLLEVYDFEPGNVGEFDVDAIPEAAKHMLFGRMGADWWFGIDNAKRRQILEAFMRLPVAMEVSTPRGLVGLVHADVPAGLSWPDFKAKIASGDDRAIQCALWGRTRAQSGDDSGVVGIGRLYCGHTPQDNVTRRGNVYFIDSGAVFGLKTRGEGHLSVLQVASRTMELAKPGRHVNACIQVWDDALDVDMALRPFGAYAKPAATHG